MEPSLTRAVSELPQNVLRFVVQHQGESEGGYFHSYDDTAMDVRGGSYRLACIPQRLSVLVIQSNGAREANCLAAKY